jgi:phosphoribosylformylglycinamidine synthase
MTARPYPVRITIRLSEGVNDPQGSTVGDALRALGHADVRDVRIGKVIDLVLDATSPVQARERAELMCRELLANPVTETFQAEVAEGL